MYPSINHKMAQNFTLSAAFQMCLRDYWSFPGRRRKEGKEIRSPGWEEIYWLFDKRKIRLLHSIVGIDGGEAGEFMARYEFGPSISTTKGECEKCGIFNLLSFPSQPPQLQFPPPSSHFVNRHHHHHCIPSHLSVHPPPRRPQSCQQIKFSPYASQVLLVR